MAGPSKSRSLVGLRYISITTNGDGRSTRVSHSMPRFAVPADAIVPEEPAQEELRANCRYRPLRFDAGHRRSRTEARAQAGSRETRAGSDVASPFKVVSKFPAVRDFDYVPHGRAWPVPAPAVPRYQPWVPILNELGTRTCPCFSEFP